MKEKFLLVSLVAILLFSCDNKNKNEKSAASKTADSLFNNVMDGHNVAMAKMGRLTRAEQASRRLLDSIQKLPGKAKQAAEPLRIKLDTLQKELSYAEFAMNKWMEEFNMDSALNNIEQRIDYLKSEKLKVSKVKDAILESLQKADSVLKKRF